ncbi:odorant receptor 24a-like [Scaptodrosophila lebanonensis]|uniref:Odorant receptor n=1 Tax=Drosophila lebanonensis TaxID=7225 RepID=A0A6J2UI39_DROLE|nr:odorant receptor 24a-like [Scaptodrosophila lebanonensis]
MLLSFLTSSYPVDRHYFLVPKFSWKWIGFYPETERTWSVRLWSFFNFFVLAYGCYAEASYGIHYLSIDVATALDALCPVASSIVSLLKMVCLWWYMDDFKFLIQRIRHLSEQEGSPKKLQYKKKYYTLATQLASIVFFFGFWTSMSYSIRNLWVNLHRLQNDLDWIYETPFLMRLPAPMLRLPLYPISYTLVQWHGNITVCCFAGADGLFVGFCIYLSVLIKSLRDDVCETLAVKSDSPPTLQEELQVVRKLEQLIDRHNELAELTALLSRVLAVITLGHFVTSSLIICASVLGILLFSGTLVGTLAYVVYCICVSAEIFLYCLGGNFFVEGCSELARDVFDSAWYAHSIRVQKMTLLIILRAQRQLQIQIPFFSPSLETLTSILRFTGSLLTLFVSVL